MSTAKRAVLVRGNSPPPGKASRVNVQHYLEALNSPDPHTRQAACKHLGVASLRHDDQVVSSLLQRLTDSNQYVRQAATEAVGQVARRGDEETLHALTVQLSDADCSVRRVACNSLAQTCSRGSPSVVAALLTHLEDKDGGVRRAALKALEKAADKSDVKAITALFSRTADPEAFVRHSAVEVLSRLCEEGDSEVVARLLELLNSDRDSRVRWAATEALGRLAVRGDSRVLTALLGRLEDEADSVRRAAATALGHVTFAPLQELELQEKHIAELEFRSAYEVAHRDKNIQELEERHGVEVAQLQQRVDELEVRLRQEMEARDKRIEELESMLSEKGCFGRIKEILPPVVNVPRFLDTLPDLAGPAGYGQEVVMPVWALRCVRSSPSDLSPRKRPSSMGALTPRNGVPQWDDGHLPVDGKNKRWILSLFELFEKLSSGKVTPMELTESRPLDVYIHRGDDDQYGLYCCSRNRLLALLMWQACSRNELHTVRCTLRPKDDQGYWGWQWASHYDGGDGLTVQPTAPVNSSGSRPGSPSGSRQMSCRFAGLSVGLTGGPTSSPSTPRRQLPVSNRLSGRQPTGDFCEVLEDSATPAGGGYPSKTVELGPKGRGRGKGAARSSGPNSARRSTGGHAGRGVAGSMPELGSAEVASRQPVRQRASPGLSATHQAISRQAAASASAVSATKPAATTPQVVTSAAVAKSAVQTVNMELTP